MEYKRVSDKNSRKEGDGGDAGYLPDMLAKIILHEEYRGLGYPLPRNEIEDKIKRVAATMARLLATLNAKNLLSDAEIFEIVDGEDQVNREGIILQLTSWFNTPY